MIGAIIGDIVGSPYEFDRGNKSKDFPLFSRHLLFLQYFNHKCDFSLKIL